MHKAIGQSIGRATQLHLRTIQMLHITALRIELSSVLQQQRGPLYARHESTLLNTGQLSTRRFIFPFTPLCALQCTVHRCACAPPCTVHSGSEHRAKSIKKFYYREVHTRVSYDGECSLFFFFVTILLICGVQ